MEAEVLERLIEPIRIAVLDDGNKLFLTLERLSATLDDGIDLGHPSLERLVFELRLRRLTLLGASRASRMRL